VEWLITNAIAAWLLPPGFVFVMLLAALVLWQRRPWLARGLAALAFIALYALSTPYVAGQLRHWLEPIPRDPLADKSGEAIVILGGGTYVNAPEYGADTPSTETLTRLRYGAHLYRALKKPVLVTGGTVLGSIPEAVAMKSVLDHDFQAPVQWVEQNSRNTMENARLSHEVLKSTGIRRIYLVTHAWHMPRAQLAFRHYGFDVIPAGTAYATRFQVTLLDFLPNASALHDSSLVFHEVIGIGWYHLRILVGR
jgi:uncharacterized SAM-binding protein YcdF (DUF218 family)